MVFNLALNYVQNYEDAQEITQDVFVSVYRSMASFDGRSTVSTWIYRITVNRCLDVIKARKRKKRFGFITALFDGEGKEDVPHFDHPGVQLEHKETLEKLFTYINELPENQRTALLLSKTEQLPQTEVAEIMGLSVKAVESLTQRAKASLAAKMKNSEGKK
ncbi:RNA polymerase sigma factor [Nemorincola caseinilytica]|uniref:RNA polymerase sigma factor n=2 Tax=Nemorincola caseinilytica TaxID=2054315 RepID=A0ABP8N5F3_9BACT